MLKTYSIETLSTEEVQREITRLENEKIRADAGLRVLRQELNRRLHQLVTQPDHHVSKSCPRCGAIPWGVGQECSLCETVRRGPF
jgi:hypothetical protein